MMLSLPAVATWEGAEEALEKYEAAQAAAAGEADPEQRAAHQATAREALRVARDVYELHNIAQSHDKDAVLGYAAVLQRSGDADLAVQAIEGLLAAYPKDGAIHLALAKAARDMGPAGAEKAMAAAQQARHQAGEDALLFAQANALLAMLYWDAELFAIAREYLDAALAHDTGKTAWRIYDVALLARNGSVKEAWAVLEELGRAVQPYDTLARRVIRKALWDFDKLRLTVPDTAETHAAYGRLLYQSGRLPDAVLALRRATSLAPDNVETWNLLGAIHTQLGSIEQAIQSYERSLEIQDNQPQVQNVLQRLRAAQTQRAN